MRWRSSSIHADFERLSLVVEISHLVGDLVTHFQIGTTGSERGDVHVDVIFQIVIRHITRADEAKVGAN